MNLISLQLIQLTAFLALALSFSALFPRNASRAHRVLVVSLACLFLVPVFSLICSNQGWGLFPPAAVTQKTSENRLATDAPQPNSGVSSPALETVRDSTPVQNTPLNSAAPDVAPLTANGSSNTIPVEPNFPSSSLVGLQPESQPSSQSSSQTVHHTSVEAPASETESSQQAVASVTNTMPSSGIPWLVLGIMVWAVLSGWALFRLIAGAVSARKILHSSTLLEHQGLLRQLERAKQNMGIKESIELRSTAQISCPVIWNWTQPAILVPEDSVNASLDWQSIFTHELAHRVRSDHWYALLAELTRCVLPWHPLVHFSRQRLYRLSEVACDAWALKFTSDPHAYADALLSFSPTRRYVFSSMATSKSNLKNRIEDVLSGNTPRPQAGKTFTVAVIGLIAIAIALTGLSRSYALTANPTTSVTTEDASPDRTPDVEDPNEAGESESGITQEQDQDLTDEQWKQKLVQVPESAHWTVGKSLGNQLASLPDGRGYRLLESNWDQIAVTVRRQILKGYYPGEKINSHYFQVMHLGMSSTDKGIRTFATAYLKAVTLREFNSRSKEYQDWYATVQGKTSAEVVAASINALVAEARNPETRNVRGLLKRLTDNRDSIARVAAVRDAIQNSGMEILLKQWSQESLISAQNPAFAIVSGTNGAKRDTQEAISLKSTDDQWIALLTAIPNNARWHVGANLGVQMSQMQGKRAHLILSKCWDEIGPDVRRQILKGFTPGFGVQRVSDCYLDILELGIGSKEPGVREAAMVYIDSTLFEKIQSLEQFREWRSKHSGQSLKEIQTAHCQTLLAGLENLDEVEMDSRMHSIWKVTRNPATESALRELGIQATLEALLNSGTMTLTSNYGVQVAQHFGVSPQALRVAVDRELKKLVDLWEAHANDPSPSTGLHSADLWKLTTRLGRTKSPIIIPTMIAIIEADNHYDTVYGVGYFGLGEVTGVRYRSHHDGAWWRRWWDKNKDRFAELEGVEIPKLTVSRRGAAYTPYPADLDTLEGTLRWMVEQHENGKDYDLAFDNLESFDDPKAIPYLIGILDADNSPAMITSVGRCLRAITGVQYTPFTDGPYWRRWWDKNKMQFPVDAQSIAIPSLRKTAHGSTYEPASELLETLDGQLEYLQTREVSPEMFSKILTAIQQIDASNRSAADIPKLIALIECDNSYQTIYEIGYFLLSRMTDVEYSPVHDGAWWRRWWEKNRATYPLEIRNLPIPSLPKTQAGMEYVPFPENIDTLDGKIQYLNSEAVTPVGFQTVVRSLSRRINDDTEIPKLIGIMDSDNSPETIYQIGEFALGRSVQVKSSSLHDGAWWKRWWKRNQSNYSQAAQDTPVPTVQKTLHGKSYQPFPAELDTLDGITQWIHQGCPSHSQFVPEHLGTALTQFDDPRAIPVLIGWMIAEDSTDVLTFCGDEIAKLTGIRPDRNQTPQWWKEWWLKNKTQFDQRTQREPIPDLTDAVAKFRAQQKKLVTAAQERQLEGSPSESRLVGENAQKNYFLIGDPQNVTTPKGGWKLLLILPGGDGSATFNPFCRGIHKNALPEDYLAVQLVAPVWSDSQERIVWPTQTVNPENATFTTESLIKEVVADVAERVEINSEYVFALGWSSGGPPLYANSLQADSPVTGTFVAMSVFWPERLGDLSKAKGHPYFILHSPDDWIKIDEHARVATKKLTDAGATTVLHTYSGGHGWVNDPNGNIRRGVQWLETQIEKKR